MMKNILIFFGLLSCSYFQQMMGYPEVGSCEDYWPETSCRYFSLGCSTDRALALNCRKTCGRCQTSSATTSAPLDYSSPAVSPLPQALGRVLISAQFRDLKAQVEEFMQNITNRVNRIAEQQLIRDQKPVLSRADVEGIINNQTTSLTDDVAKLKERPEVNTTNFLTRSQVSNIIQAQLTPIYATMSVVRKSLRDLQNIVVPTVEATCNSIGDLSYSQKYVALCPGNCNIAPHFVWGTIVYTTDSYLCAAAIHAGKIAAKNGGSVTVIRVAGQISYEGTTRNNITSQAYTEWNVSFRFE